MNDELKYSEFIIHPSGFRIQEFSRQCIAFTLGAKWAEPESH